MFKLWERAIVDAGADKLGFPILPPHCIQTIKHDYILVCITDEKIYKEIYAYLVSELGENREKIIWIDNSITAFNGGSHGI